MTHEQESSAIKAITNTFMWSFKKGDNIIYNYRIVWELYAAKRSLVSDKSESILNKPIIVILTAIIECILDDFVHRTKGATQEGVQNITNTQLDDFKTKKRDKLEQYIQAAKMHNIFNSVDDQVYKNLDAMRQMRNRVHIQNNKQVLEVDENIVYTEHRLKMSEKVFEFVINAMILRFYRWGTPNVTPDTMPYPWE